jgi:hypothetical protein
MKRAIKTVSSVVNALDLAQTVTIREQLNLPLIFRFEVHIPASHIGQKAIVTGFTANGSLANHFLLSLPASLLSCEVVR